MEVELFVKRESDLIFIVDDVEINRLILREILENDYNIIEAASGTEALKILFEDKVTPAAVLLDIIMPGVDGFQVLEQMKRNDSTKKIPVLFITASNSDEYESRGLKAGASDYITKPFNHDVVRARVDNHLSLTRYQHELEQIVEIKTKEATRAYDHTLEILASIIEFRSLESGSHVRRTVLFTEIIIWKMLQIEKYKSKLTEEHIQSLRTAAALHDIGKIGISDGILLKPSKLTAEEFAVMKTHTTIGSEIIDHVAATLQNSNLHLKYAKEICHFHHERWDGAGYPFGLKGEAIPLSARIVAIVDVYDALVNPRCYKPIYSHEESMKIIKNGRGTQFDPNLVDIVLDPEISDMFCNIQDFNADTEFITVS